MNEQDVRTLMADLADTTPPPSRVDVAGAMTSARRRARLVTSVAASVLVVGVAAGATYVVIDRSPPSDTPTTTVAAAPVADAPERFDPLVRFAEFGWLPLKEKLTWRNTSISGDRFSLSWSEYVPDPVNGPNAALPAPNVNLRLYAAGVVPMTEQPMEATTSDGTRTVNYGPVTGAPDVNGAAAYWVGVPGNPDDVVLKWRYAPDGWAELSIAEIPGDVRTIMHRIAGDLRVGGTDAMRFPFHLTGLAPGLVPVASQYNEGGIGGPWDASLDVSTRPGGPTLGVAVRPMEGADEHPPNTTVDGRPARRDTFGGEHLGVPQYSDRLHVADVDGLAVSIYIDASTAAVAAPLGQDGVVGAFRALTVHPDHADWTGRPLR
jgi:hypothetical protein